MRNKIAVVFVASLLGLGGCSSGDMLGLSSDTRDLFVEPSEAAASLQSAPICCEQLAQLSYKPISYNYDAEEELDARYQAFSFKSGKSFVLAYKLPALNTDIPVRIESVIGETVFAPTVALLSDTFEINRVVPASSFQYHELKGFSGNKLSAAFRVNTEQREGRVRDAYMLIYTTDEARSQSTQIVHPERSRAKAQAKADPGIPDPLIPHSAFGLVNVTLNPDLSKGFFSDEAWFGSSNADPSLAIVEEVQPSQAAQTATPTLVAPAANRSLKKPMLEETESFYNKLISEMVKQGEVEKALKLVEEAEYAGSRSARDAFIEAVKNK
ncbi:MalM family protein [Agarivorans sp.]|uniref:MalM family protein n=1 Tax=Agarivorans sp. TaxID=1872412 RepID=UPI003D06B386